jgi:hypothetical protein
MATKRTTTTSPAPLAKAPGKPRNVKNIIPLGSQDVAVYASPRISNALAEVTKDMTLYHGVRLSQVLQAVYFQGQKDGARHAFAELDKKVQEAQNAIPHRNPGQPKKSK